MYVSLKYAKLYTVTQLEHNYHIKIFNHLSRRCCFASLSTYFFCIILISVAFFTYCFILSFFFFTFDSLLNIFIHFFVLFIVLLRLRASYFDSLTFIASRREAQYLYLCLLCVAVSVSVSVALSEFVCLLFRFFLSLSLCQSRILFCLLLLALFRALALFLSTLHFLLHFYLFTLFTFFSGRSIRLKRNSNRNMQLEPNDRVLFSEDTLLIHFSLYFSLCSSV